MTNTDIPADAKVAIFNCTNLAAAGLMLRGKAITGDWQVHKVGCRDLNDLLRLTRGIHSHFADYYPSIAAAREAFNAEMGGGGSAGFEEGNGWDFDQHTEIKPCTRGL